MFIKKNVLLKFFKRKDSNEICLLKKRLLLNFLKLKIPTNVFIKKKVILKLFKAKDSNKCVYQKKKSLLRNFLNVKIPMKYGY